MTLEEWDRLEGEWADDEQHRVNRMRVYGYTLAVAKRLELAEQHLEHCVDALMVARKNAEHAQEKLNVEREDQEILIRVLGRGDRDEYERIAMALEEIGL